MATTPLTSSTNLPATGIKPSIGVSGDAALIEAIAQDQPFPATPVDIEVGQLNATVPGAFPMTGVAGTSVTFNASAQAGLAAYQSPQNLARDLGFRTEYGKRLDVGFLADPNSRFMVVRFGFDASGSAKGKMALNPSVSISFGASGSVDALFAFVLKVPLTRTAGKACKDLVTAWCTPGDVANNPNSLPPDAWIVTEVTGQLDASLGVEAGHDFNWVKRAGINGLDGDIGLRISLGLQAGVHASIGGKQYLVLNREQGGIRLRLFRATTKGWGFALNLSATVTPSTGKFLPGQVDDFIKGILGISDPHLLALLKAGSVADIADALTPDFVKALKQKVEEAEEQAVARLQDLLTKWDALPAEVTSAIWRFAGDPNVLKDLREAAQLVSTLSEASLKAQLDTWLHDVEFMSNPVCHWLEAAAAKSLFELYESPNLDRLRVDAQALASVLDGSLLQGTLTRLKSKVDDLLDLPALEKALQDKTAIPKWIVQRLAVFLGIDTSQVAANVTKINQAIVTIRAKSQELYAATVKALNQTYGFSLAYAYDQSSTDSALLDVVFDPGVAAPQLAAALRGDFRAILSQAMKGVHLNSGTLTHAIQRHSHVEVHLPWWTGAADDLASGYATGTFADTVDGRVHLYEAGATDTITSSAGTNLKRFATCSFGLSGRVQGIRRYNVDAVDLGFSFVTAQASMTRSAFEYAFEAAAEQYFPNVFGDDSLHPNHAVFQSWVLAWDKVTDQASGMPVGDGVIGNTWARLQIKSRTGSQQGWVSALLDGPIPDYRAMSLAMQASIRKWLLIAYASDPSRFKNVPGRNRTSAFLAYTALPPLTDMFYDPVQQTLSPNPKGDLIWDIGRIDVAKAVTMTFGLDPLRTNLAKIYDLLLGIPELKGSAEFYDDPRSVMSMVLDHLAATDPYLLLLQAEAAMIYDARRAFESLRTVGANRLQDSLPAFATALTGMVSTFNKSLTALAISAPEVMRNFAPLVFQEAVNAMCRGAAPEYFDAILDVAVLKGATPADPSQEPGADQTLLRQRIVSFG